MVFHFAENPYFTNDSLKICLQYLDGSPHKVVSDTINWNAGQDLTKEEQVTTVKKGKNKGKEKTEIVDKVSFFRIFTDSDGPEEQDDYSHDSEEADAGYFRFDDLAAYIQLLWYDFSKYNAPTFYGVTVPQYALYLDEHGELGPAGDAADEGDWSDEAKP